MDTTQKPLHKLTIVEAADKLKDWQDGKSGGCFITRLFCLMESADLDNFKRLEVAFPSLARVYKLWRDEPPVVTTTQLRLGGEVDRWYHTYKPGRPFNWVIGGGSKVDERY